jgi:hypothetical protein
MRAAIVVLVGLVTVTRANAHGMRTAYVEVVEIDRGKATVHLRLNAPDPTITVTAAKGCTLDPADAGTAYDRTWLLDCPGGLQGSALELAGIGPIVTDAIAWIGFADGTTATRLLRAGSPQIALNHAATSSVDVARQFVGLGLVHIATGYDHLLFLLLLVLLLGDVRSVLLAETAFTISHTLSFSATALGWIHVSSAAAEACIALSLLLLAADIEIVGAPRASRWPWRGVAMALVFGFVHGLGFAGALREIGLPDHAISAALIGFGGGIELGQVAFLAIVLALLHMIRNVKHLPKIRFGAVYAIGGLSAYWLLVRVLALR